MTRKRALRRMKIKAAFAAAWEFVKGYACLRNSQLIFMP